jgi:O-acetylserine/cysteine efflux transporter
MWDGILLSFCIALLWSLSPILHKLIYRSGQIHPQTIVIIGGGFYLLALIVYALINFGTLQRDKGRLKIGTILLIAVTVILTTFVSNLCYVYAIKEYPAFLVTGISYTAPLFTVLFAWLFINEHGLSPLSYLGAALIVAGVGCLANANN